MIVLNLVLFWIPVRIIFGDQLTYSQRSRLDSIFDFLYLFFLIIFRMDTEKLDAEVGESLLPKQNGV